MKSRVFWEHKVGLRDTENKRASVREMAGRGGGGGVGFENMQVVIVSAELGSRLMGSIHKHVSCQF